MAVREVWWVDGLGAFGCRSRQASGVVNRVMELLTSWGTVSFSVRFLLSEVILSASQPVSLSLGLSRLYRISLAILVSPSAKFEMLLDISLHSVKAGDFLASWATFTLRCFCSDFTYILLEKGKRWALLTCGIFYSIRQFLIVGNRHTQLQNAVQNYWLQIQLCCNISFLYLQTANHRPMCRCKTHYLASAVRVQ